MLWKNEWDHIDFGHLNKSLIIWRKHAEEWGLRSPSVRPFPVIFIVSRKSLGIRVYKWSNCSTTTTTTIDKEAVSCHSLLPELTAPPILYRGMEPGMELGMERGWISLRPQSKTSFFSRRILLFFSKQWPKIKKDSYRWNQEPQKIVRKALQTKCPSWSNISVTIVQ